MKTRLSLKTCGDAAQQLDRRMAMAQVIEFYIPERYKKKVKWTPPEQRGKVLTFPVDFKKSA